MLPPPSSPLRTPGYKPLLASYTINELGDAVGLVALSVLVFDRTDSAFALVAFFMCARVVPALVAPALTARLDQLAVGRVLPGLYVLEALVFVALALQVDSFTLPVVLALGVVDGTLALAGRSLSRGAIAVLLQARGLLREGNALVNVAFGVASVAGLAAGGVLVSAASLQAAILVDAGSFLAIAVLLGGSRTLPAGTVTEARERFRERLRAGLQRARRDRLVGGLIVWQGLAFVFFTLVIPIEVVYVRETLGAAPGTLGLLLATWSGGILVGSLAYVRLSRAPALMLVLGSSAAVGVGYAGMGLSRTVALACAFSVVGGLGNGIQWVSVVTLLQEATPPDFQARISGLLESVAAAAPAVGYLVGGALTALLSPSAAYLTAGIGVLVLVALGALRGPALLERSDIADAGPGEPQPAGDPIVDERSKVVVEKLL